MARQVLPIVGAIVGAYFGNPQLGWMIGSIIGNAVDPQTIKGPKLGEAAVQTAAEGVFRPIVLGTAAVKGNIIHRGNRTIRIQEEEQGKGGGPVTETERAYWTYAIRICEGPISNISRIWEDEKLVYDARPGSEIPDETIEFANKFRAYIGDEDQLPDPALEAYIGVGNVNAYRGTAYIVFDQNDLTDRGERVPDYRFEINGGVDITRITRVYEGYYGEIDYPPEGSFIFNPTNGEALPIPAAGGFGGSAIIYVRDDWAGFNTGEYRYEVWIDEGDGPVNSGISRIGTGYIGLNVSTTSIYYILCFQLVAEPNTKVNFEIYHYEDEIEALIAQNEQSAGFTGDLASVVAMLSHRVESPEFDVTSLEDEVFGIVFAGDYTAADAIRTLMPLYMFDCSEYDDGQGYRIHYHKRGQPVVATLTSDDIVEAPEESTREDALERPRALHMHYESPMIGYAPAKASPTRNSPDVLVTGEVSMQVPVAFNDKDEPWRRADVMLKVAWAEIAGEQEFTLPLSWIELVPTDCIGLVLRGSVRRLRITEQQISEGIIACKFRVDRQSAYTSTLTGIALPAPTPPPPSITGPTEFAFLDIPARDDMLDRLHYTVAATGVTPAWYGYQLQRKLPGDPEFVPVDTFRQAAIMGELVDPVDSASEHYTDTTNVVRVQLFDANASIESISDVQFLSEGGAFALEKIDGSWEVMQYRDSDDEGDGVFALTTLLRGRLASGPSMHAAGAKFVLLRRGIYAVDALSSWLNQLLEHRPATLGRSPELAETSIDEFVGRSQIEFPVANILLERDSDSIDVRVVPRHRFGTEDMPVRSVHWISYDWTATDGTSTASGSNIADTFNIDVTGWDSPVTVTVSQRNRYTGAGPSVSELIA